MESDAVVTPVDALPLAVEAGSPKAVNVALIGVLAAQMDFGKEVWLKAIEQTVPEKFIEMNIKAFDEGYVY